MRKPPAVRAGFGLSRQAGLLTSVQPVASPSQIDLRSSGKTLNQFKALVEATVPVTALGTFRNDTGFPILPLARAPDGVIRAQPLAKDKRPSERDEEKCTQFSARIPL